MPTKPTAKSTSHPFPYFGAGEAQHYEFGGLEVRFARKPTPLAIKKIIALAPGPIRPTRRDFKGRMLAAHSTQYINDAIMNFYGDRKDIDRKARQEIGKNFYVTANAGRAFDAAIEEWLANVHALCPIEFVYRAEDLEAGGTRLSKRHSESLAQIPRLMKAWNADESIGQLPADELRLFAYCAQAIVAYGKVKPALIPASLKTLFPFEFFQAYFKTKDQRGVDQLIASLPDSVPALAAVEYATDALWEDASLKERAGFLYFIRDLVDEKSIDSSQHAGLIFEILYAAALNDDKAFVSRFIKLVRRSNGKVRVMEELAGRCNGIAVGYGKNKPDRKLAAKIAKLLLAIPLTRSEMDECEFLDRLRVIARGLRG